MPDPAGFQGSRSGFRARDFSPDSVIFTTESSSTFSLFSSTSASVERCSFASDQDSVLTRHEFTEALSGPDPDPNKPTLAHKNSVGLITEEKTKFQGVDSSEAETTEDETIAARNSFSRALKECQDRRLRSDTHSRKPRPVSLDLNFSLNNNVMNSSSSPKLGMIMNKQPATIRKSPGIPKGWSSERVPPQANANRRNSNTPLLYNNNGKTLPSKWEDAERWIFSPVSGDGAVRNLTQRAQRRPRAKSGPLGPSGVAYYQMFSPFGPPFGARGQNGNLDANSPFSVKNADGMLVRYEQCESADDGKCPLGTESFMARSVSIHGCSEMITLPVHQGEKCDGIYEDSVNDISHVSRRDMATQMSPEHSSIQSSPRRHSSFSSILHIEESRNKDSNKFEVTMTRWSKKSGGNKKSRKGSKSVEDWKRKAGWDASNETSKSISTIKREEAKIGAWENLQKAKAEAAIRKLEMKLEKKRSSSIDRIMNKLRSAEKKAQDMRSSNQQAGHQMARSSNRKLLASRCTRPISSLSGCFSCHAF